MNELPVGWSDIPLDNLLDAIEAGRSFKCSGRPARPDEWGVIKVSAMTWHAFNEAENKAVLSKHHVDPRFEIRSGDLLFSRANTVTYVGAVVQVGETRPRLLLSDKSLRLVPCHSVSPRWLLYYLRSQRARRYLESVATGTKDSMRNISQASLRKIPVPLAPIPVQDRITATIEEQFSRLDAGVAGLERGQQNLRRMRAAVLEAAVPSAGGQIPEVPLGDLVAPGRKIAYGVLVPGDHDPNGVPFVRVGDLINRQVSTQDLKRITPDIAARYPRTRLQGGEVLLSLVGTIGRTAVVPPEVAGANAARALAVIPVQEAVEPRYVAIALSRAHVTRELTDLSHEVVRKTLNLEDVRRYKIPLPGYPQQLEIVKAVETEETWIKSVEEVVARTFRRADGLRSSILQAAFSGRLV